MTKIEWVTAVPNRTLKWFGRFVSVRFLTNFYIWLERAWNSWSIFTDREDSIYRGYGELFHLCLWLFLRKKKQVFFRVCLFVCFFAVVPTNGIWRQLWVDQRAYYPIVVFLTPCLGSTTTGNFSVEKIRGKVKVNVSGRGWRAIFQRLRFYNQSISRVLV